MIIRSLKLMNFRNYQKLDLLFSKDFNIIFGENAQGKTNILEAIFLCSTGRSHRTSKDTELVQFSKDAAKVELVLLKEGFGDVKIEIEILSSGKKGIKVNEIPLRKMGDVMGHLNSVIFSPEDLRIIKDEPQIRRRFLDMFISQIKPAYYFDLQQYIRAMHQRNSLLKQIREDRRLMNTVEAWNIQLAYFGIRVIKERNYFIERIGHYTEKNHGLITTDKESLKIKYQPSVRLTEDDWRDPGSMENRFLKCLEDSMESDIMRASTSFGPHRDDIGIHLNQKNIRLYGSQGQQRTAALSMKMAQVDVMKEETGEIPVLLLDDVMSELDRERQENLSENMKSAQTFLTGTEKYSFNVVNEDHAEVYNRKYFYVNNGIAQMSE